jgi:hypothetical protein
MTVGKAMDAFVRICKEIFQPDPCDEGSRSERLACAVERVLSGLKLGEGTRLEGDVNISNGCHVYVLVSNFSRVLNGRFQIVMLLCSQCH